MHKYFLLLVVKLAFCRSLANYELFNGFNNEIDESKETNELRHTSIQELQTDGNQSLVQEHKVQNTTQKNNDLKECPTEEIPSNIGPYKVPTQKDVLMLIKTTVDEMFDNYRMGANQFLENINKTNNATTIFENNCDDIPEKVFYKQCVNEVKNKWILATNKLLYRLERKKNQTVSLLQGNKICKIRSLGDNPLKLINRIAIESVSMKFALSGYLRRLSSCSTICNSTNSREKPESRQRRRHFDFMMKKRRKGPQITHFFSHRMNEP